MTHSARRTHRSVFIALFSGVLLGLTALTGCADPATAPAPRPEPTATADTSAPDGAAGDLGFDEATVPPGTEINMGDSLGTDVGWTELPVEGSGRWRYVNADRTCTASYRQGPIAGAAGMGDREASDAALASATGWSTDDLAPILNDGAFIREGGTDARVAHRQASIRIDEGGSLSGSLVAARVFVDAAYSVEVTVTCDGADIDVVAGEVLGKTLVQVIEP